MQVKWPSGLFSDECKFLWFLMWKFFNILLKVSWNVLSTRPLSLPFFRSAADVLWQSLWRGRDQGGGLLQVGVQQRPRRAAGQGRGPQVCHRLLHLAPWGRGRVRQQLGPLRTAGRTIGSGERILRESECSGDDSEDSESAKSFCINRKKQEKKFFNWERLCYGSNIRSCYFVFFLGFLFFLAQPNVFFETNKNREKR